MLSAIGILIGLVLGLTGAGGSVFAVPLLVLLAGLPIHDAIGISLGAVAVTTLYGSLRNFLQKQTPSVLWKPGIILAATGVLIAPAGKWVGLQLEPIWLSSGFSLLAMIIAINLWIKAKRDPQSSQIVRAGNFAQIESPAHLCNLNPTGQFILRPRCVSGLLFGGIVTGFLSGLFGVGGGFLIVPLLLVLSAVTMAQAVSTSLLIIALISSSGFVSHLVFAEYLDWLALIYLALGGIFGMFLGQVFSQRIANALLQKIFSAGLVMVSLFMLIGS
jgi:uncharacterized membrane protein YfcA